MRPPPLVLVVDDAQDNREAYCEYLRYSGFAVAEAGTGHEALSKARALAPDLVLLDLRLPDVDGFEVTRRLRTWARTRRAKIAVLSACVFPAEMAAAIKSGCDTFIRKPCPPDAVVTEIRRLLRAPAMA
jgi:CheY-like chemotaxis protein